LELKERKLYDGSFLSSCCRYKRKRKLIPDAAAVSSTFFPNAHKEENINN